MTRFFAVLAAFFSLQGCVIDYQETAKREEAGSIVNDPMPEDPGLIKPRVNLADALNRAIDEDPVVVADIKRCKKLNIPPKHYLPFKETGNLCVADRDGQKELKIHPGHIGRIRDGLERKLAGKMP
ncbi:MAG: hypothetical protein ACOZBH_01980 [Patescibacteria group bacterium]